MEKIIRAELIGIKLIQPKNEPWKKEIIEIHKITVFYENNKYEKFIDGRLFGNYDQDFFNVILPNKCKITVKLKKKMNYDEYYDSYNSFKSACFNKGNDNPYQLPKYTLI